MFDWVLNVPLLETSFSVISSLPEVFYKKLSWQFRKIHSKIQSLRSATLFKKRLWHRCFPVNFPRFLRAPFFTEHLRWLLLYSHYTLNGAIKTVPVEGPSHRLLPTMFTFLINRNLSRFFVEKQHISLSFTTLKTLVKFIIATIYITSACNS